MIKYAVNCYKCGMQPLTYEEYQMSLPDDRWKCPKCGGLAEWDDEVYERYWESMEEEYEEQGE